jgi:hypothetical protein
VRYALLLYNDENAEVSPEQRSVRFAEFSAFADDMVASGVLHDRGLRLRPTTTATTVHVRDGDVVIADGPFAETKEQIAGLYVIECNDIDEAIALASAHPGARVGTIEVRPVWEM